VLVLIGVDSLRTYAAVELHQFITVGVILGQPSRHRLLRQPAAQTRQSYTTAHSSPGVAT